MEKVKIKTVLDDYSKTMGAIRIPDSAGDAMDRDTADRIRLLFSDVTDYRVGGRTKYPIREILLVTFTSVLCGYTDYEEIAEFGRAKIRFFKKIYPFSNGICSHDTFRRAISLINTSSLQKSTAEILEDFMECIGEALGGGARTVPEAARTGAAPRGSSGSTAWTGRRIRGPGGATARKRKKGTCRR